MRIAAGFIIYRRLLDKIEFLLLQTSYGKHHWTPPKGHVDQGEAIFTAAQRETQEEAGFSLDQLRVVEEFKDILQYSVQNQPKVVHYWLAELIKADTPVILSDEHIRYKWGDIEATKHLSGFDNMLPTWDKAYHLLTSAYVSAGVIIYRVKTEVEFLLIQSSGGSRHWMPPKGQIEAGESSMAAAQRETLEEAGLALSQYEIAEDYRDILFYPIKKGGHKSVVYYLARLTDDGANVKLSGEHQDFTWANLTKTRELTDSDRHGQVYMEKAYRFILNQDGFGV